MTLTHIDGRPHYAATSYPKTESASPTRLSDVAKPRIYKGTFVAWECKSADAWGYGANPFAAYAQWAMALKRDQELGALRRAAEVVDRRNAMAIWNGQYENKP